VEQGVGLDTGVAACRLTSEPINLVLRDSNGNVLKQGVMPIVGKQGAVFLREIWPDLPTAFHGFLLLQSARDFAPLGNLEVTDYVVTYGSYGWATITGHVNLQAAIGRSILGHVAPFAGMLKGSVRSESASSAPSGCMREGTRL
jgi:hypothetical protein